MSQRQAFITGISAGATDWLRAIFSANGMRGRRSWTGRWPGVTAPRFSGRHTWARSTKQTEHPAGAAVIKCGCGTLMYRRRRSLIPGGARHRTSSFLVDIFLEAMAPPRRSAAARGRNPRHLATTSMVIRHLQQRTWAKTPIDRTERRPVLTDCTGSRAAPRRGSSPAVADRNG